MSRNWKIKIKIKIEFHLNIRKLLYCDGSQILAQFPQRSCGTSILRHIQTRLDMPLPEQPAVADPAPSRRGTELSAEVPVSLSLVVVL